VSNDLKQVSLVFKSYLSLIKHIKSYMKLMRTGLMTYRVMFQLELRI